VTYSSNQPITSRFHAPSIRTAEVATPPRELRTNIAAIESAEASPDSRTGSRGPVGICLPRHRSSSQFVGRHREIARGPGREEAPSLAALVSCLPVASIPGKFLASRGSVGTPAIAASARICEGWRARIDLA
jgi:hypothetical protein